LSNVLEVTDIGELRDLIETEPNLVVKYWATWCGPCRQFAPAFEAVANGDSSKTFVAVDVDVVPDVVVEYGVRGIPAVHQWLDGERRDIKAPQAAVPLKNALNA
jgi:thioredoxin 1